MARLPAPPSSQSARFTVLAASCVLIAALYFLGDVLIPIALAILITFLLTPVANRLEKWRFGRIGSVLAVVTTLFGLIAVLGWISAGQVLYLGDQLPRYQENIVEKIQKLRPGKGGIFDKITDTTKQVQDRLDAPATQSATQPADVIAQQVASETQTPQVRTEESVEQQQRAGVAPTTQWTLENPLPVGVVAPKPSPLDTVGTYLGVILGPLGTAGLVMVFVLFMLLQREDLRDRLIRLMGQGQLEMTTTALDDASTRISRYLLAQAIVNGSYGLAVMLGLWIIGAVMGNEAAGDPATFPSFVLWGLLCALLRFVPYIGPWIAAAFPMLVAFAVYDGFGAFLTTMTMFVVIELLSNNVMEPWLYGVSTGMSAVAVLVSAVFWTFLWGPVGLLLATPLTVCLVVLGKYVQQLQFLDILLGDEPVLAPHERVYQRLLALDEEDATETSAEYLNEMSLERVYDTVLVPTLALAEQDRHRGKLDSDRQVFIRRVMRTIIEELGDRQAVIEAKATADRVKEEAKAVVDESKGGVAEPPTPQPKPVIPRKRKDKDKENGTGTVAAPGGVGSGLVAKLAAVGNAIGSGTFSKAAEQAVNSQARTRLPQGCVVNVVCLPAHDEADEIVGLMLAQLLEREGYCAHAVSMNSLASEMLEQIQKRDAQIVCVSAIPPAAVAHSRYLCKRIHARFPEIDMVVGLWAYKGDLDKAKGRITCERAVSIYTTLSEAMNELNQMAQPILFRLEQSNAPTEEAAR